jgi:hypothetical protein
MATGNILNSPDRDRSTIYIHLKLNYLAILQKIVSPTNTFVPSVPVWQEIPASINHAPHETPPRVIVSTFFTPYYTVLF